MLDAHVAFECERIVSHPGEILLPDAAAIDEWIRPLPASVVVDPDAIAGTIAWLRAHSRSVRAVSDDVRASLRELHDRAADDPRRLADVVSEPTFDRIVELVVSFRDVRGSVIEHLTSSEVYSRLIAHVLYEGIKGYVQNENIIAKKVPGASRLMKMGQKTVSSAAPGLEKAIDRQLTAFVNAQVSDSIRDSRQYLDRALSDDVIRQAAQEFWQDVASRTIADLVALVPVEDVDTFIDATATEIITLIDSDQLGDDAAVVADILRSVLGDDTVGDLLDRWELDADAITGLVDVVARPVVAHLDDSGALPELVRHRLEPFYRHYASA